MLWERKYFQQGINLNNAITYDSFCQDVFSNIIFIKFF